MKLVKHIEKLRLSRVLAGRVESSLLRDLRGIAASEFALALPLMMMLLVGGSEMARWLLIHQKVEKVADTIADLVSQTRSASISVSELDLLMSAATQVMQPFAFDAPGVVIVTSVSVENGVPTVRWQYSGGGSLSGSGSTIGSQGGTASLPAGFTLNTGENVIITEVYYTYNTVFGSNILGEDVLYKSSFHRPRLGVLTSPPT